MKKLAGKYSVAKTAVTDLNVRFDKGGWFGPELFHEQWSIKYKALKKAPQGTIGVGRSPGPFEITIRVDRKNNIVLLFEEFAVQTDRRASQTTISLDREEGSKFYRHAIALREVIKKSREHAASEKKAKAGDGNQKVKRDPAGWGPILKEGEKSLAMLQSKRRRKILITPRAARPLFVLCALALRNGGGPRG